VLATGGAGKVFLYTTNPDTATGDGMAMAWRAGCRVANLEFVQFHPTCLYHPHAKSFLITEAMRGEGALLRLPDGSRFMPEHDERAELAPRDVVARAIDYEMKKRGLDCVYLDITHKPAKFIVSHFPNIHARCLELGIDITREWIPDRAGGALHLRWRAWMPGGRADAAHLYAIGETSCTGLHGANRLASNSLLECLVYGRAAANDIAGVADASLETAVADDWDESRVTDADEEIVIAHNWHELRRFMWDYVGIVRTTKRLERASHRIKLLNDEIDEYYRNFRVSNDLIELRNLVLTAELIVNSARLRHESRGSARVARLPRAVARGARYGADSRLSGELAGANRESRRFRRMRTCLGRFRPFRQEMHQQRHRSPGAALSPCLISRRCRRCRDAPSHTSWRNRDRKQAAVMVPPARPPMLAISAKLLFSKS
jgi:L-aspartate oxidase